MTSPCPLFDKRDFKNQMSKIYEMETESDKRAYQNMLREQAEKEMKILKAELLQRAALPKGGAINILKEFHDYIANHTEIDPT